MTIMQDQRNLQSYDQSVISVIGNHSNVEDDTSEIKKINHWMIKLKVPRNQVQK